MRCHRWQLPSHYLLPCSFLSNGMTPRRTQPTNPKHQGISLLAQTPSLQQFRLLPNTKKPTENQSKDGLAATRGRSCLWQCPGLLPGFFTQAARNTTSIQMPCISSCLNRPGVRLSTKTHCQDARRCRRQRKSGCLLVVEHLG